MSMSKKEVLEHIRALILTLLHTYPEIQERGPIAELATVDLVVAHIWRLTQDVPIGDD